jgi:tryptophan synthase alpha chain
MNRITELFKRKGNRILNVYCTAGYPFPDSTFEVMLALQESGVDMIELGMPYSDPLADGPVIQASSAKAIENGMTIHKLFEDLKNLRNDIRVPVILMGYLNPALQFGFEKFCAAAAETGIDGLIIPDLPMYEFETEYGEIINKYGLKFIFLVTPETSDERVRMLDSLSSGFLYAVSSSSTTGNEKGMERQLGYFKRLQDMNLKNNVLIGFGIKNKETFDMACRYANGAIIGTAYIRALEHVNREAYQGETVIGSGLTARDSEPSVKTITKQFIDGIIGR